MEIRTWRMVRTINKYGEVEPSIMNPDSSSGIYFTVSVQDECHMISQNRKMQEEENKRASKLNPLKKSVRITKSGRSFVKLLEATAKLPRNMNT